MLIYFTQVYILVTATLAQDHQGCTRYWFGPHCWYPCVCSPLSPCDDEGRCFRTGRCQEKFFGPMCQFRNIINAIGMESTPDYIADSDDTTCNPDEGATSLTVTMSKEFTFFWYRIVVRDNIVGPLPQFTTKFNNKYECDMERKFIVDSRTLDITCGSHIKVTIFSIEGVIAGSICSVYISAGRNVALNGITSQSSTYETVHKYKTRFDSSKAVDNNYDGEFLRGHCSSTQFQIKIPEWRVTFKYPAIVHKIRIYNRNREQSRLRGFIMEIINAEGRIIETYSSSDILDHYNFIVYTITPVATVRIRQSPQIDMRNRMLTLCEVAVFGDTVCPTGTYGMTCDSACNCSNDDVCNSLTGVCASVCLPGFYGPNCKVPCGHCALRVCDYITGSCQPCEIGYTGTNCLTECPPGKFGDRCKFTCSVGCSVPCNKVNGLCNCKDGYEGVQCTACNPGYYGNKCKSVCAHGCTTTCDITDGHCNCTEDYKGSLCAELICPEGYDCSERCFCKPNHMCDIITGQCTNECMPGFYGNECNLACNTSCNYRGCDYTSGRCLQCGAGYTGHDCGEECEPGTYGMGCEQRCSQNCATKCNNVNGKCICREGFAGSMCTECLVGLHGDNCDQNCSQMCKDSCNFSTGHCFGCNGRRIGPMCEECPHAFYGPLCETECPVHCADKECDNRNGTCRACEVSYHGPQCQETCLPGFFGTNCAYKCSKHCADMCNQQTGTCTCQSKYVGTQCTECPGKMYGENCSIKCPTLCYARICHADTGHCMSCIGNRNGPTCEECPHNFYGALCHVNCPENCYNKTCHKVTGECFACAAGFSGRRCFRDPEAAYWRLILVAILLTLLVVTSICCCLHRKDTISTGHNRALED